MATRNDIQNNWISEITRKNEAFFSDMRETKRNNNSTWVLPSRTHAEKSMFWIILGSGEKHHKYVGFRYVIMVFLMDFFSTLTYLITYLRVRSVYLMLGTRVFIIFDHANACTSMHLLVEIHNRHYISWNVPKREQFCAAILKPVLNRSCWSIEYL